jgi:hypothetical protein
MQSLLFLAHLHRRLVLVITSEGYQLKLRNLAITAVLFAGSLHASILYNQMSGLGIVPGPNSIFQDFSDPTSATSQEQQIASPGTTGTGALFTNLTLTANTNLYYDPNGAFGCGLGRVASPALPNLVACVGNYSLAGTPNGSLQNYPQMSAGNNLSALLPDMAIVFSNSVVATSFLFAAPGGTAGVNNVELDVYNGAQKIDTLNFRSQIISGAYILINENQSFNEVVLTQLSGSGMNTTFNALVGDVQATTANSIVVGGQALTAAPEPGTIGLIGFGLAGVGYFARRRKA